MTNPYTIATSYEASLNALAMVVQHCAKEVLDTLAVTGPMLALEDPNKYEEVLLSARQWEYKQATTSEPMPAFRAEATIAARKFINLYDDCFLSIEGLHPELRPTYAIHLAELHLQGKAPNHALAWGSRFARTFQMREGTDDHEIRRHNRLIEACAGTCAMDRATLWRTIRKCVFWYWPNDRPHAAMPEERRILQAIRDRAKLLKAAEKANKK